jgi:hypothetical protein
MRLATIAAVLLLATPSFAIDRDKDGYFHTGDGVRTKKVAFINVKVYQIEHKMKELPADHSKQGVIAADVDKAFAWKMLRSVDSEKIRTALRDAYAKNGYSDNGKIEQLIAPLTKELKEGTWITIRYDAAAKKTTLSSSVGSSVVPGADFMKATWSIWFGNIDQPALSDALVSKIK